MQEVGGFLVLACSAARNRVIWLRGSQQVSAGDPDPSRLL